MPYQLRVEFAGAIYHVMSRGNGKSDIFFNRRGAPGLSPDPGRGLPEDQFPGARLLPDAQPLSLGGVVTGYTWQSRHIERSGCEWTGCWGSTAFNRTARRGAEAKAERIIRQELKRLSWTESDLEMRAKSDPAKLALAARVRRETTQTLGWIAHRMHMGTRKSFSAKLHRWRKAQEEAS